MKTFTVRDMDRKPSEVLRACDVEGVVMIRSRSGRSYEIRPAANAGKTVDKEGMHQWLVRHKAWMGQNDQPALSRPQFAELDRLLAGE